MSGAFDTSDDDDTRTMRPVRPTDGAAVKRAIERMARTTHLRDQSTAASRALGENIGAFASGLASSGMGDAMVEELAHHYLDRLLPGEEL